MSAPNKAPSATCPSASSVDLEPFAHLPPPFRDLSSKVEGNHSHYTIGRLYEMAHEFRKIDAKENGGNGDGRLQMEEAENYTRFTGKKTAACDFMKEARDLSEIASNLDPLRRSSFYHSLIVYSATFLSAFLVAYLYGRYGRRPPDPKPPPQGGSGPSSAPPKTNGMKKSGDLQFASLQETDLNAQIDRLYRGVGVYSGSPGTLSEEGVLSKADSASPKIVPIVPLPALKPVTPLPAPLVKPVFVGAGR